MAQVLKEERRNRILDSAKEEFLVKGISATSMRAIAKRADMTVGNIYRYFPNKEEIVNTLMKPVFEKLNKTINSFSNGNAENFNENMNEEMLKEMLMVLADTIVNTQESYRKEIYIFVCDDDINEKRNAWLLTIINNILKNTSPPFVQTAQEIEMLSCMIATSIFTGLRKGIKFKCENDISKEGFRKILRFYLLQIFTLLKW